MAGAVSYLSVDRKGQATLPEDVRASLVPRDQLWFHHPEMQGRLRKAEADRAEGRTRVTRSVAETKALLDRFKARRRRGTR